MADDSREESSSSPPRPPRGPANIMPGGTAHTAGGEDVGKELTYFEVVRNLPAEYYWTFYKQPCVRDSQLTAISAGFVAYMVGAIIRRPVWLCSNYAVGTWTVSGCAHYQVCVHYRRKEKDGMRQARELMAKKRATMDQKKEARRRQREQREKLEEEERLEEQRQKSWSYWVQKNVRFW